MKIDNISVICDRTYASLRYLYLNSKEIQQEYSNLFGDSNSLSYAKEFASINIRTARQSGHSSAIIKFIKNDAEGKWAIVGYKLAMLEQMRLKLKKENVDFVTMGSLNRLRSQDLNGIIVDCSSLFPSNKIDEIYETGFPCMKGKQEKYFIFVG